MRHLFVPFFPSRLFYKIPHIVRLGKVAKVTARRLGLHILLS